MSRRPQRVERNFRPMHRSGWLLRMLALCIIGLVPVRARAQVSMPIGASHRRSLDSNRSSIETKVSSAVPHFRFATTAGRSRAKYVIVGAIAGAVILGGTTAIAASRCNDCMFAPEFIGAGFAAGAGVGALLGWIVHDTTH